MSILERVRFSCYLLLAAWRPLLAKAWHLIETGGVLCQIVLYPSFVIAGIYMLLAQTPQTVQKELGSSIHIIWAVMLIACPVIALCGVLLQRDDDLRYAGAVLMFGSSFGVTGALATYVAATLQSPWLGRGVFAVWVFIGLTVLHALITARDAHRLHRVEVKAKEEF